MVAERIGTALHLVPTPAARVLAPTTLAAGPDAVEILEATRSRRALGRDETASR